MGMETFDSRTGISANLALGRPKTRIGIVRFVARHWIQRIRRTHREHSRSFLTMIMHVKFTPSAVGLRVGSI